METGAQSGGEPSLSIIIPTYRRADDITHLLESLEPHFAEAEVVVVDDGSPDPSVFDAARRRFPAARFVRLEPNQGPGAARNRGAQEAQGEVLLFLDSDTAMVPGSIVAVREYFAQNPDAQVCSGRYSIEPINEGFFPRYKALLESYWVPQEDGEITFVGGRCFAVRRSAFLDVGGFDTTYAGADVEDYDLGYRLRERHGRIWFLKNLVVRHRYPTAWKQAELYYRRVILWMQIQSGGGDRSDNVGTSPREGLINVLHAALPLVLLGSFAAGVPVAGLVFLGLCIAANSRFMGLCLKQYGAVFAARALAYHTFLAIPICAGAAVGLARRVVSPASGAGRPAGT